MSHNKQEVNCRMWIIAVAITIVLLNDFSYSSLSAFSLQSVIHHQNQVFSKKQDGDSNSNSAGSSNTKSSDNSNNEGNSNTNIDKKNNQRTNRPTDTGSHITGGQQQQVSGEDIPPIVTAPSAMPSTTCEQGSNCTDQQGLSDRDRSSPTTSNTGTSGQNNNSTPFVLPFP